ncbi:hypothetical protein KI387_023975, partial [Taxus chinensis]
DKLTKQEENVLQKCKEKAVGDFMTGALLALGVTWAVTPRLTLGNRLTTSGAAAVLSGILGFDKALNSCLDHALSLEGSRLQKELATILLTKHSNNPWRMRLVNKHYYLEKVFDDSNMDVPLSRWRRRTVSGDAWSVQRTNDVNDGKGIMENLQRDTDTAVSGSNHVEDLLADPLEFIFGHPKRSEDVCPDYGSTPHGRHRRAVRRRKISTATAMTNNKDTA